MDSEQLPKKRSATQLTCGCLTASLMLIVLLPGIAFLIWIERNAQEVAQRLAAIRLQGLPTTFEELDEFSDLPREKADNTQPIDALVFVRILPQHPAVNPAGPPLESQP